MHLYVPKPERNLPVVPPAVVFVLKLNLEMESTNLLTSQRMHCLCFGTLQLLQTAARKFGCIHAPLLHLQMNLCICWAGVLPEVPNALDHFKTMSTY